MRTPTPGSSFTPSTQGIDSLADPLAALPPLATPEGISWWPPAPGWWLLAAALAGTVIVAGYFSLRYWQRLRQHHRRAALLREAFDASFARHAKNPDPSRLLYACNLALRQYVRACGEPRALQQTPDLHWLAELDGMSTTPMLSSQQGQQLLAQYQAHPDVDAGALQLTLRAWSNGLRMPPNSAGQRPVREAHEAMPAASTAADTASTQASSHAAAFKS